MEAKEFSDFVVRCTDRDVYKFAFTFTDSLGHSYVLNTTLQVSAYNINTYEDIILTDEAPVLITGNYDLLYVDESEQELYSEEITLHVPQAPKIPNFTFVGWQASGMLEEGLVLQAVYTPDDPMGTPDEVDVPNRKGQKLVRKGNVYVLFEERTYDMTGARVK